MYQYTALQFEHSNFRLLRLLKGPNHAEVECELSPQSLQNVQDPYEALSYTWGSNELVECITLDGEPFWVTDNLHSVLKSLRLRDSDRILWIDAICINQEDKIEQSQQVQQMGQIYEGADKVLFWLGKATPQIIALMETLDQFRNTDPGCRYEPETFKDWPWRDHSVAIKQLLNREWFTRVWILQEAAKARRADVCCGIHSIPSEIFVLALSSMEQTPPPHCKPVLDIMAESFRSTSWWAQKRDLSTLLRKFHGSKATDERDKIYALLGMSSDPLDAKNIAIDYRKPTPQVVHEAVTYLLQPKQTRPSKSTLISDVIDLMCSFKTLDVTYFVPAEKLIKKGNYSGSPLEPCYVKGKWAGISIVNDPKLLLFEERSEESLGNQKTCYNQVIKLMPDQNNPRDIYYRYPDPRDLHIFGWGDEGNRVKVVVVGNKRELIDLAAEKGYVQILRQVLQIKLGTEEEEMCEWLSLHRFAREGRICPIQRMLDAGADVNAGDGATWFIHQKGRWRSDMHGNALTSAVSKNREEVVKMLLDAGANIDALALRIAVKENRGNVLKILLDAGANVDADTLRTAVDEGREEIVKMLLDAGANVDASVLAFAAYPVTERYRKILLDSGVDVDAYALEHAARPGPSWHGRNSEDAARRTRKRQQPE